MLKKMMVSGALILSGLAVTGCADEYGYGHAGYAAYGGPYGYADTYYDDGYYGGFGPYYGWYGGYYYPGDGFYVYDRFRRPYRWNGLQQRYWQGRGNGYRGGPDWRGFGRGVQGNYAYRGGNTAGVRGQGDRGFRGQPGGQATQGFRGNPGLAGGGGFHGGGGGHSGRGRH